jgi:hypothetical protein
MDPVRWEKFRVSASPLLPRPIMGKLLSLKMPVIAGYFVAA